MASAAIATILNPADSTETVLFTVSPELQLTIQRRPVDQSAPTVYPDNCAATGNPVIGPVVQPASLTAVNLRNVIHLYGFTQYKPAGSAVPVNLVTLLSPYLNPIQSANTASIQTTYGAIAATIDPTSPKTCYLYYLKDPTDNKASPQLMQATISDNAASVKAIVGPTPDPQSNLGVAIDPAGNRYVFYHDKLSKQIQYVNAKTGAITPLAVTVNSFKFGTALAVTSSVVSGTFTMWLYYQNQENSLVRLIGTLQPSWKLDILQSVNALDQSSLIATNLDSGKVNNHIFYVPQSTTQLTEVVDNVSNPISAPGDKESAALKGSKQ